LKNRPDKLDFQISYVISTKNRLPYLKILFDQLLKNILPDEEIIVVDGASTDGTKQYLESLLEAGRIHQFISEPDSNQAEGWNKAMLMAQGIVIKKIIDDDVFSLTAIRKCKEFMIANPDTDICISNYLYTNLSDINSISVIDRSSEFKKWRAGKVSLLSFSDVHMLIRKSSLSTIGLYDTHFVMMDWEYSIRATYLKSKIAYYTGYNAIAVHTPESVTSRTRNRTLRKEGLAAFFKYGYAGEKGYLDFIYRVVKSVLRDMLKPNREKKITQIIHDGGTQKYAELYARLDAYNLNGDFEFIS
jgi:glycosyltransferase involved in cell wall biosynthesis